MDDVCERCGRILNTTHGLWATCCASPGDPLCRALEAAFKRGAEWALSVAKGRARIVTYEGIARNGTAIEWDGADDTMARRFK